MLPVTWLKARLIRVSFYPWIKPLLDDSILALLNLRAFADNNFQIYSSNGIIISLMWFKNMMGGKEKVLPSSMYPKLLLWFSLAQIVEKDTIALALWIDYLPL